MKSIFTLISVLLVPIFILNILGDIVAGIWLAILRDWEALWVGILAIFASHFPLSLLLMIGMIFILPAQYFIKKNNKSGILVCSFLSLSYTLALITIWSIIVLWFFISSATSQNIIPRLIWSYGTAMSPWMFFAQKDQQGGDGNEYSMISLLFAEIAYISAMIMILFLKATMTNILALFGIVMGACLIVEMIIGIKSSKSFGEKLSL